MSDKKFITRWSRDFQGNLQEDPNGSWVLAADAAIRDKRMMDKIDALQALLTAADERADTATSLIQRIVANFDTEIEFHEDVEPNDLEHDQVLAEMRVFLDALKPAEGGDTKSIGGKCWSCKEPVTLIEWVEADGNCPHCNAEIDEAEGIKP